MADIFISYSKTDQSEARLLAAFLEAQGYSVWWDTSLAAGDKFRNVIMTELGRARAVVVIWTQNSIGSDWVHSEAGRAHADRKLIPVKSRALSYKDIPPPFDNMHIENLDDRDKILGAVVAQLAKPAGMPASWKVLRYEALSWLGVAGASITLASNLRGVVELAKWVRLLLENWVALIKAFWSTVLFFLPKIAQEDAILLTVGAFLLGLLVQSGRAGPLSAAYLRARISIALILLAGLLLYGPGRTMFETASNQNESWFWRIHAGALEVMTRLPIGESELGGLIFVVLFWFLLLLLPPLLLAVTTFLLLKRPLGLRFNAAALSVRLWRVLAGVALIFAFNATARWIEAQPWAASALPAG